MPRKLHSRIAILCVPFFALSCAVPTTQYTLAVPAHVSAAVLDPARPSPVRRVAAKVSPNHRLPDFTAKDCKLVAKATGGLPEEWQREADFSIKVGDETIPYRLMTTAVMPGEVVSVEVLERRRQASFTADSDGGALLPRSPGRWTWKAPREPGMYALRVVDRFDGETICVNAFVMRPYNGGRDLNGYRVGAYPRQLLNGDSAYKAPKGFIEVHPDMRDLWVAPHFKLDQFLCKQAKGNPEYLLLSPRLLLKLEYLLARAHERGIEASTFQILSAFRTPWYNANIGNETRYSRHAYGDAADIYIDEDGDGRMDDLDGDGKVTPRDADMIYELVEDSMHDEEFRHLHGGLGLYAHTRHAGPFVHVDARGTPIRWGMQIRQRSTPARMTQRSGTRDSRRF